MKTTMRNRICFKEDASICLFEILRHYLSNWFQFSARPYVCMLYQVAKKMPLLEKEQRHELFMWRAAFGAFPKLTSKEKYPFKCKRLK